MEWILRRWPVIAERVIAERVIARHEAISFLNEYRGIASCLAMTRNSVYKRLIPTCTNHRNYLRLMRGGFVYIMTNKRHTVLYTGVTNDLERRVLEHVTNLNPKSFTSRYKVYKLVWYEAHWDIRDAIAREKQIKGGPRWRKLKLIEDMNPEWKDLSDRIK